MRATKPRRWFWVPRTNELVRAAKAPAGAVELTDAQALDAMLRRTVTPEMLATTLLGPAMLESLVADLWGSTGTWS